MTEMRENYHAQLDSIVVSLADVIDQIAAQLNKATRALLDADLQLAEEVISGDAVIDDAATFLKSSKRRATRIHRD